MGVNTTQMREKIPQVKSPEHRSSGIKIKLEGYSIVNMGVFRFLVYGMYMAYSGSLRTEMLRAIIDLI